MIILLDLSCCFHSAFMSISSAKQLWRVLHERECTLIVELATSVRVPLLDKFNYSRVTMKILLRISFVSGSASRIHPHLASTTSAATRLITATGQICPITPSWGTLQTTYSLGSTSSPAITIKDQISTASPSPPGRERSARVPRRAPSVCLVHRHQR